MKKLLFFVANFFFALSISAQVSESDKSASLQLLNANKTIIGITNDDISNSEVSSSFLDEATGIRYVYLNQTYLGIPVFNQMQVLSFRDGKLLSNTGGRLSQMEQKVNVHAGTPLITAEAALLAAIADRGLSTTQNAVMLNTSNDGKNFEFNNMGISRQNITVKLMWSAADDINEESDNTGSGIKKDVKLAWQVYIIPTTTSDYWLVRIDATNRNQIGIDNLTLYCDLSAPEHLEKYGENHSHENDNQKKDGLVVEEKITTPFLASATYRVIPFPFESPSFMPGPSTAWHATRSNPWTNATVANATTLNWHTGAAATDYDYTRGNNVWAYQDRQNNGVGTIAKSASSTTPLPALTFNFTPDYTLEPTVTTPPNQQFNITNLFYWNNIIHDIFYGYGFTEAAGNFQDDNMGRGGVGNDYVNAEAQDGGGANNANFSTPPDGANGRMVIYLWTAPTPDRDADVDNGIVIHEYGHGIAKRTTGGPANTSCLANSEQGGEGISDYFFLMLTQDWSTATLNTGFNSPRSWGTYALNQPTTGAGMRQQLYTTDFAINNSTYASLSSQSIPHGVGWVWCSMLWEVTWEIINEAGTINPNIYDANGGGGNTIALKLIMEGLRTQPCSPGFVDARNAILQADTTLYGGLYSCAIWRAFAKRGVGLGAFQGSVNSITDQLTSFTIPPACVATSANIEITGQASEKLDVHPVPNQGVFNVRFYNQANEQVTVWVFDAKGAEVYQRKVLTTIPYTTINVDLSTGRTIKSGTYMVEIRGADGRLVGTSKIIVSIN